MSLSMIMTLSLLVYSMLQRHLRKVLANQRATLTNQINKEINNPTIGWIFQLIEGIDVIYIRIKDEIHRQILGISQIKQKIIRLFYPPMHAIHLLN